MKHLFSYVSLVQTSSHLRTSKPNLDLIYLHKIYALYVNNWCVETEDGPKRVEMYWN